ncbi:MAG: NAD-dependent epimerase/dehydratase family protein [SAR202 cluster bacterium]|nr:NAD-dependent epimerase/dehydratase family protein [SAR202 cluster bacterium]
MTDWPARIAITGASGYVGSNLIRRLEREDWVKSILAIDIRSLPQASAANSKVTFVHHDVLGPLNDLFKRHGTEAVVHLAFVLQPGHNEKAICRVNIEGTRGVLESAALAGVRQVVYLGSTTVYGAHPDNPPLLTEESPVRPVEGFQYGVDKARAETVIQEFSKRHPEIKVAILRGCPVLGPQVDNFISRAFSKPFLVALKGFDPPMQLLHEEDLSDLMTYCITRRISGLYNVAGDGVIRWSEMGRMLGRKLLHLPPAILYGVTGATWRLRLQSDSPPSGLAFIQYPWTASTEKIRRELGVRFRYSSRDAWMAFAQRLRGGRVPA